MKSRRPWQQRSAQGPLAVQAAAAVQGLALHENHARVSSEQQPLASRVRNQAPQKKRPGPGAKGMLRPTLIESVVCGFVVLVAIWCFVLANTFSSFVPFYEERGKLIYQNLSTEVDLLRNSIEKERRARYSAIQSVMERTYVDQHNCDRRIREEQKRCHQEQQQTRRDVASGSTLVDNGHQNADPPLKHDHVDAASDGYRDKKSNVMSVEGKTGASLVGDMSTAMRRTHLSICMPSHPRKFRTETVDYLSPTLDLLSDQLWGFDVKNVRGVHNGFELSKLDSSVFRVAVYDTSGPYKP